MMEFADFGFTPPYDMDDPSYKAIYNDVKECVEGAEPGTEYDLAEYVLKQYRDAANAMLQRLRGKEPGK